jgi:CRISPR-associated protein Csx14
LLEKGLHVQEVVILRSVNATTTQAASRLRKEFETGLYQSIAFKDIELYNQEAPVTDLDNEEAFQLFMGVLFKEIRAAHSQGRNVHIGIAGGRKSMAIGAMVVAQMLFTENDKIWHLFSDMYDADDQRLHAAPEQNSRLVEVPVLRYGHAAQMLAAFTVSRALSERAQ